MALAEVPGITIEDRTRLFLLAVKQGAKAERFEEAYDIYFQRLKQDSAVLGAESKRAERRTLAVFLSAIGILHCASSLRWPGRD